MARNPDRAVSATRTGLPRLQADGNVPDSENLAAIVVSFIPAGAVVADIGLPLPELRALLPGGCRYLRQPAPANASGTGSIAPNPAWMAQNGPVDIVLALGLFDDLAAADRMLAGFRAVRAPAVASGRIADADARSAVRKAIESRGYRVVRWAPSSDGSIVVKFAPDTAITVSPSRRVLVLSYSNTSNFGDRIGVQLLNQIMPSSAELVHGSIAPWSVPDGPFDLVVVGIGNSIFHNSFVEALLPTIRGARRRIGIFGTQYRDRMPDKPLRELISMLDIWHARNEEDILLFGRGNPAVRHLGDWVIAACAMGHWRDPRPLFIDDKLLAGISGLDRMIEKFQEHRYVFSTRLHPLVCALTSAEGAGYSEQRLAVGGSVSGKFRSLTLDVFGRTYPEGVIWPIDRAAVQRYRDHVLAGIAVLRRDLEGLLE